MNEERIKCECCDELFTRSLYDKHWEALATDATKAWRYVPLDQIMPTSRLLEELELVGYLTAGDVLDAEPDDLAADVYGIGPKRAIKIRQQVFDYVKPFGSQGEPQWVLNGAHIVEIEAPRRSPLPDLVSALCVVTAVGLIAYLLAWWVL
jgi:hypothetical protein